MSELPANELTFEQQQEVSAILENFRNNPSNSNKFRYELFAWIDAYTEQSNTLARHDEITKANKFGIEVAKKKQTGWEELASAYSQYLDLRYEVLSAQLNPTKNPIEEKK